MRRAPIAQRPWARKPKVIARFGIDPELRALVRERAGNRCECCGERLTGSFEAHHRKFRSRGGQDSACNLAALCGLCHRRVHGHPVWATAQGFAVAASDDPAAVPMAVRCEQWHLLTADGRYAPVGDAA